MQNSPSIIFIWPKQPETHPAVVLWSQYNLIQHILFQGHEIRVEDVEREEREEAVWGIITQTYYSHLSCVPLVFSKSSRFLGTRKSFYRRTCFGEATGWVCPCHQLCKQNQNPFRKWWKSLQGLSWDSKHVSQKFEEHQSSIWRSCHSF